MIDAITLKVEPALNPVSYYKLTETAAGSKYHSKLANLDIISYPDYSIIKGSLPKYRYGSNVETLPFSEVSTTIQNLSNDLNSDLSGALILGVDWSTTIETEEQPKVYYSILGETWPFQRIPFKNSLYYNGNARKLLFYDKAKEAKVDGNLLRNEARWTNLKKLGLKFNDLAKPEIFTQLTQQWLDFYLSINKLRKPMPAQIKTPTQFSAWFDSIAIEALGGKDEVMTIINNLHAKGQINDYNKSRIKRRINQTIKTYGVQSDLEKELTEKFTAVAKRNFQV